MSSSHSRAGQSAAGAAPGTGADTRDAEMPATEKDLAEDAPWKKIQQNTFTRWCNEHLKCVSKRIANLQTDLSDGLRLIALLEVLSQKKMHRKHNQRPTFRQMQLENVSVALEFLDRESIKLVSIDSKAIVDGNLKLILGLIWTLILHYSISMPMWDEEEDEEAKKQTPKQRLLGWIQNKLPQLPITNFSRDWQSGRALGALVDSCAPGLCPDWDSWDASKPVNNAREAMQQADDWLGIPQVITPEEIVDPNVDEHSVMTYLSQFPKAKLKPGAPLRPKLNPKKARAYGPGIEPTGNMVKKRAEFTVETRSAGQGEVLVYVEDPAGHQEEAKVTANNDKNRTFSVWYVPEVTGTHKVTVLFAGQHIAKSPFEVYVDKSQGDASKVTAQGPGLEPSGNIANKTTYFEIFTAGAGSGEVEVVIQDPAGQKGTVEPQLEARGDSTYRCSYQPTMEGVHTVHVTFAGVPIPRSPYTVAVGQACNPGACRAVGRGLQPKGVRVKEVADFKVYTKGAGSGELKVVVKGPKGEERVKQKDLGDGVYGFEYYPTVPGTYTVTITWGGQNIGRSPFEVKVGTECGNQKVRAWGPGLEGGVVGKSADFVVEAIGDDVGTLGFSVEGPSQAKIECDDKGDGSCDVRYWPQEAGEYAVHVLCNSEDIRLSPFMADIREAPPDFHPDRVKARGPGLEKTGVAVNKPAEFTVDAKHGGKAPLRVQVQDNEGCPVEASVKDNGNGTYSCSYVPRKPVKHTAMVSWGGVSIPNSPFRVNVGAGSHPNKVKVYGPGVAKTGLKAHEPTYFTVDCTEAGQGDVSIGIKCAPGVVGPTEADIDFDIIRNDNDTFTVKYTPRGAGSYTIMVLFADQATPTSPIRVKVEPSHDASKVKAEGPGLSRTGVELGKPTHFTVNAKAAGKGKLDVQFSGPAKGDAVRDVDVIDHHDNTYTVKYTPLQQGPVGINVTYGGDPIPKSPFSVGVSPSLDLSKIKVSGLGEKVDVGKDQEFTVKSKGAGGQGKVVSKIVGPSGAVVPCKVEPGLGADNSVVRFVPREEGPYEVEVTYDGVPVPGSPFPLEAVPPTKPSKVKAFGPGLQGGSAGSPARFTIDTKGAGVGGLGLTVEGPCEAQLECLDNGDGTCSVSYVPTEPGDYNINILFADTHIPGSPFKAHVVPCFDASKVKCSGPGLERATAGEAGQFHVDCSSAGSAELTIEIRSEAGLPAEVHIQDHGDGTHTITYIPLCPGAYTVTIKYGGQPVPNFPSKLQVEPAVDTSGVQCYGPGVEGQGVFREATTEFSVDARALTQTGGPHVKARVANPSGNLTETYVQDRGDGTYKVEYTPYEEGLHSVDVTYDGSPVPSSPFQVPVTEGCDPTRVRVHGPGLQSGTTNKPNKFTVETRGAGTGGLGLAVEGPSEAKMSCMDNKDGSCSVEYIPYEAGTYSLNVTYGGHQVPGSPFKVPVHDVTDASKVKCSGPGLSPGMVRANLPQSFQVDTSKAGVAPLQVKVQGPKGLVEPVDVVDNADGTQTVNYVPSREGPYSISVLYGEEEVPRSPFKVKVLPTHDASKVKASGPGLNTTGVPASLPVEFTAAAAAALLTGSDPASSASARPSAPLSVPCGRPPPRVLSAAEPETMAKPAQGARYRGSIHDFPNFDPSQDAETLYNAMKGFGSDKEAILELITSRSNRQRQEICQNYKSLYGKDLIADLKYELTGKFERLIVGLMRPPAYGDAKEIKDAISGIGTDEKCLTEILASRTNEQIHQLVAAYKDAYERDLEADVIGDTSGHFQKMLVVLLQGTREEDDVVSEDLVHQDVQDLYEAGELKWGTDEAQFIYILGNRSKQHLRLVFDEYLKTTGKPIEASIRGELSGDFEKLMLAVVKCIRSTPEYFAERLFKAMKGLGTRDNTLIRIMVSRSELDMLDIREIFRTKYEKSLYSMIKNDTSGEYKKALLKLCGGDDDAAGQFFPEAAQVAYQMWELSAVARVELKGTVHPAGDFNPDADAKALRKAMKGLGTDEDTIIDIVTRRSNAQRQQIRQTFKSHFGRDLMADLKSELSGDLARLILGLMMPPAHYDAKQLKKAMEGAGTDEKALIEILATRTNAEIRAINEAYKEDYHKSLEDALSSDTSGHFKRILISLATGNREEGGEDRTRAQEDAKVAAEILEIADTSSGDKTSLETRFMTILCTRSYQHLRRVFQEFVKMTNYDVEHTIKKEMSGDVRDVFVAIVQSVKNKPLFFADKLYKSMKGAGTDEKTLTRIMISRSEIDLLNIRREFIEKYDKSLHQAIEGDTSGHFLKALLAICGGED